MDKNGGDYAQANEKNALSAMPDAWKTAPIGGEFNSDLTLVEMITDKLDTTLSLLKNSHTTFLGPHFPNGLRDDTGKWNESGIKEIQKALGYKLWVKEANFSKTGNGYDVSLIFRNDGNAPMYFDWNTYIYCYDSNKKIVGKFPLDIKLSSVLPEEVKSSANIATAFIEKTDYVAVGIEDPMNSDTTVSLAMNAEKVDNSYVLWNLNKTEK